MQVSVSIIGTGNVATHFAQRFSETGILVREISGRSSDKIIALAEKHQAKAVCNLQDLDNLSDLYIICVNDDQIKSVVNELKHITKTLVHTSGATSMAILGEHSNNFGVLYPLQTFKQKQAVDWNSVSLFLEASNQSSLEIIELTARTISNSVYFIDSAQRLKLHAAAVFVSNFVNYLYITAQDILNKEGIPFSVLQPLIIEVAQKMKENNPLNTQTGPAIRKDIDVQKQHLSVLNKEQEEIYVLLSKLISQRFD